MQEKSKLEEQEEFASVLEEQEKKLRENETQADEIKKKHTDKLHQLEDGKIMDARSDYTQEIKEYYFSHNNQNFILLDVPGIEGSEKEVIGEITKAVQKAHAVFYITKKPTPPQESTLKKIKDHLGKQAKVYTIYNKPITSPSYFEYHKDQDIANLAENEKSALEELDTKMKEALGEHYIKSHIVSALIALLSVAKHVVSGSDLDRKQKSFFEKMDKNEIFKKSQLGNFTYFLFEEIIDNAKQHIETSNINKIKKIFLKSKNELKEVSDAFEKHYTDTKKDMEISYNEFTSAVEATISEIKTQSTSIVSKAIFNIRESTYKDIDSGIDNEKLEIYFSNIANAEIQNAQEEFITLAKQEWEKLTNKAKSIAQSDINSDAYSDLRNSTGGTRKLDIDDGLFSKIFSTETGVAGATIFTALRFIPGPIGWGISAATGLLALGNLIFGSDDTASKQKEAIRNQLNEIEAELNWLSMRRATNRLQCDLEEVKKQLEEAIQTHLDSFKTAQDLVDTSRNKIEALEKNHLQ